ncbi:MAG: TIR domain-containing protein [Flavobacteriaceae bacterium]|nr:TIR domain-containing protein [Flavobacteriaceae bacterium]
MAKRQVFYSFHYKNDVMRAAQIRNIGAIEGNKPVSENDWEEVKRKGDVAVEKWIDDNMKYRSCVVVLVGEETANRKWVKYEIQKAWKDGKMERGLSVFIFTTLIVREMGNAIKAPILLNNLHLTMEQNCQV